MHKLTIDFHGVDYRVIGKQHFIFFSFDGKEEKNKTVERKVKQMMNNTRTVLLSRNVKCSSLGITDSHLETVICLGEFYTLLIIGNICIYIS